MIKIDFEQETRHGTYRDAITLPDDHTFTLEQIEAMKQQRVDNWVAYMDNPPQPEPEPEYIEIDGVKYLKAE
jgi:hypothetical protein